MFLPYGNGRDAGMSTNGRRKSEAAADLGSLQGARSAAVQSSAPATLLQSYSQLCCSTGMSLAMHFHWQSLCTQHGLVCTATERSGGDMTVLTGKWFAKI